MANGPVAVRTLILYATPTGPLAEDCRRYFAAVSRGLGPTTAQTYPPHCSLTGFFHRTGRQADTVVASMGRALGDAGPVPHDAVDVITLARHDKWIGLELSAPWLVDLTAAVAADHSPGPGEDALRPKDWLHLSLAYGVADLDPYAELASELIDPGARSGWEVRVWERHPDGSWTGHEIPQDRADFGHEL